MMLCQVSTVNLKHESEKFLLFFIFSLDLKLSQVYYITHTLKNTEISESGCIYEKNDFGNNHPPS